MTGRGCLSDIGTITTIDTGAAEQILKMCTNISWMILDDLGSGSGSDVSRLMMEM